MWVWGPAGDALASAACGQTRLPSPLGRTHTSTQTHSARSLALSLARPPPLLALSLQLSPVSFSFFFFFFWYHRVALKTEDRGSLGARHLQRSLHWEKTWSQLQQPPTPPPASRAAAARTRPPAPGRPR